jgi:probable HAF family extracellular repeat protein
MTDLGTLGPGWPPYSAAYGINDSGQVVGVNFASSTDDSFGYPFLYSGGKMIYLGLVYAGLAATAGPAYGINDSGQVVGRLQAPVADRCSPGLYSGGKITTLSGITAWPMASTLRGRWWGVLSK